VIVCLCRRVSDRAIRAAVEAGAHTVEAVGRATGAGTDCGGCRGAIVAMIAAGGTPAEARAGACPGCPRGAEAPPLRAAAAKRD
jgi:bacterioferritin-associated ferredoxin